VSEIRRSMVDPSLKGFLSGVTHSSTAKAVVSCVGGLNPCLRQAGEIRIPKSEILRLLEPF